MHDFHSLKVVHVEPLTPNAVALTFEVPHNSKEAFQFVSGQYITIKHEINGEELRRAYSISSSPSSGKLTVGIKKMPDGSFSKYANENIKVGDILEIMPPEGRFIFKPDGTKKTIAAFAAGSGITPIMSIAQSVLEDNPNNIFLLVYGNQNPEETMYLSEIQELKNKYTDRFFVKSVYSRSNEPDSLFGRIESSTVNLILKNKYKELSFDSFYLCGPEEMIHTVSDTLKANGIEEERILFELFSSSTEESVIDGSLDGKTAVEVLLDDETFTLSMNQKEYILDAVLKENIDAPYSCQGGGL